MFIKRLAFAAGVIFLVSACDDNQAEKQTAPPPPEVTVAPPLSKPVTEWDEYVGRFQAIDSVDVRSRISGFIDTIAFTDGQIVNQDQLLFVIDQRPYKLALSEAESELEQAKANLELADRQFKRAESLIERGNISRSVYDERFNDLKQTKAAVRRAEVAIDEAKLDLVYTEIRAPVAGRISRRLVSVGSLITGGTDSATILTNISSMDPLYFYFEVSEADYLKYLRLNDKIQSPSSRETPNPVRLSLLDENDFSHQGLMNFVGTTIDEDGGSITGRALVPNPETFFIPGMFAKLRLRAGAEYEALLVPDEIIGSDQSNKFVMSLGPENKVEYRQVELGPIIDGLRVIRSGIEADEKLIINGLLRARPGNPVTPKEGQITAPES